MEEVQEAVNEMKSGKAPGLDEFPVECLKKGGMAVLEWLVRLLNLSFGMGVVPMDWRDACVVPMYKGNSDNYECSNSRGISLLSVVGKLFGRVLIKRVRAGTECAIGEEHCRFKQGRECMDQVFAVRQVCRKISNKLERSIVGVYGFRKGIWYERSAVTLPSCLPYSSHLFLLLYQYIHSIWVLYI